MFPNLKCQTQTTHKAKLEHPAGLVLPVPASLCDSACCGGGFLTLWLSWEVMLPSEASLGLCTLHQRQIPVGFPNATQLPNKNSELADRSKVL